MAGLPDIQLILRPGIVEMGWGHPDPALLPVDDMARAADFALRRDGPAALAYGAEQGPGRLIEPLAAWLARREGSELPPEQLFITGGVSQGLDLLCTLLTRPSDAVLVEAPSYHLAQRIFHDHGLCQIPVHADEGGLRPDALAAALAELRREGRAARFLYTVPTFGNPTGATLSLERRQVILSLANEAGLTIVEDDVYRHLWYDAPPPPSLFSLAPAGRVIRLGSFSKLLAPGLRLGWLTAAPELVRRCAGSGLLDSGGGVSHFAAHVVAAYLELGLLDDHVERLQAAYRRRRAALLAALARHLPPGCRWIAPGGGFFLWLQLPAGCDSAALLSAAERAGVSYVPGGRFFPGGGGERYLRLAFSLLSAEELAEGARRFGDVLR
ncbi:MAG: PLP-dependent aminotransferase family protein [Chloroflexi bacterium]|nr:PLP-dependent aminotransferase family protein [Chloroflexota bacterium]